MGSPTIEQAQSPVLPADSTKKLDQIVQNFHTKVAALVLGARMKVKPIRTANGSPKMNKWYQIETEEIDDFREELRIWKNCGSLENRPPPMIIEVYLDASSLKESQSLVIIDEDGKRWDVMGQLNVSQSSNGSDSPGASSKSAEVILERWRVELKTTSNIPFDDFGPILPTIYKKAIVFFRSLFITTRLLPAWKFANQGIVKNSHPCLIPRCRIRMSDPDRRRTDLLKNPIDGRREPVTDYLFGDLEVPVGRLSTTVTYRNDCNFRVDDSESLLSSRFMGVDEHFFKPSLPPRLETKRVGSLRDHRRHHSLSDVHQTYGSLSTFHGENPLGTSPMSALRAVKPPGSDTSSPPASIPSHIDTSAAAAAPHSLPISGRASAARIRAEDDSRRRPSISFQPFKAGSLSGSPVPRHAEPESPASANSLSRPGGLPSLQQARNRSSLTAGMPASLRGGPPASAAIETPATGSPRPASASRYSSSFSHRRGRLSIGGISRAGDEENSSGRQSLASSIAQPGSGLLAEIGAASYSSLQTDEDDISDFLKALDSKKTLKSFEPAKMGDSATSRTVAQLSKFLMMKESNNVLTESMTSSAQLQPGTSTSPGKPVSPHTAHTPAIPSRLSENSIIDYAPTYRRITPRGQSSQSPRTSDSGRQNTITQDGTTAIDIPLSPRLGSYQRRPSSVAQQIRPANNEDETDLPFATTHRSISLGAHDREPPTLSVLLGRQTQLEDESIVQDDLSSRLQPAAEIQTADSSGVMQRGSAGDTPPDGLIPPVQSTSPFQRRRYTGMASLVGHRPTAPQSSRGSFNGPASRMGRSEDEVAGEEPLVFTLSEMDALGRRSVEEGRPSGNVGSDQPAFEPRGISRRGWAE
ncbi:Autophagy-related protein 13 [Cladobotryum mycophilum]|uniref:Autophagy-related protein 13 n=1 Tax=Cladobotryum mycophilum TaxID=491253 RepID=A0ABR0SSC5_9HYPO